jgi:DtxR family manganese transport transcriptional regulator
MATIKLTYGYFNLDVLLVMSFKRVRSAHRTENTEDYLELIGDLLNKNGEARIVDIAQKLDIAQATANKTIKRLLLQGYIKKQPYRSIFLTLKGQLIASKSKKKHKIVFEFLKNLGVDSLTASADSEGIEHHVSEKTLIKMEKFNKSKKK